MSLRESTTVESVEKTPEAASSSWIDQPPEVVREPGSALRSSYPQPESAPPATAEVGPTAKTPPSPTEAAPAVMSDAAAPEGSGWSFAPPLARAESLQVASIEKVASGQKLIIYSILANLGLFVLSALLGDIAGLFLPLVGIAAITLAILGLVRVTSGLGNPTSSLIIFIVLVFVPLVGLLMLVVVNARATRALRAAGYQVGLLGAR